VLTAVAQACRDASGWSSATPPPTGPGRTGSSSRSGSSRSGRRWYLVAYDLHRHDWRSFRLDRLDARADGRPLPPRDLPADDAAAFVRAGLRNLPTSTTSRCWSTRLRTPSARGSVGG
jgi:hypothetical protein